MAIRVDSVIGEGYAAYADKVSRSDNPYISARFLTEWSEWDAGWCRAFEDRVYRMVGKPMELKNDK
jgi:hypothetical protein